jgi:hypothetical protein
MCRPTLPVTRRHREGTELPWEFLRRSVRPFHLAVAFACVTLFILDVLTNSTALSLTTYGDGIGWLSLLAAVMLTYGWAFRSDRVAMWGLLVSVWVWAFRASFYLLPFGTHFTAGTRWASGVLSVAWVVGSGGAWLLERAEIRHQDWMARGDE